MGGVRWFGFRGKLLTLIGLCVLGFVVLWIVRVVALDTVKVDGPLYKQITRDKEVVNDLTTPRLFIREPNILLHHIALEPDPARQRGLVDQFRAAEREYMRSYAHWERELPDGPTKDALRNEAHPAAVEFFEAANREFLPAAQAGPADKPKADALLRGRLTRPVRAAAARGRPGRASWPPPPWRDRGQGPGRASVLGPGACWPSTCCLAGGDRGRVVDRPGDRQPDAGNWSPGCGRWPAGPAT